MEQSAPRIGKTATLLRAKRVTLIVRLKVALIELEAAVKCRHLGSGAADEELRARLAEYGAVLAEVAEFREEMIEKLELQSKALPDFEHTRLAGSAIAAALVAWRSVDLDFGAQLTLEINELPELSHAEELAQMPL